MIDINLIFILNSNSFFSKNLLNFEDLTQTKYRHHLGDVVTFNERLTAIGGYHTSGEVAVYEDGIWNDQTIPRVGHRYGKLHHITSLTIKNRLYVFGNIPVFNQD